MNGSINDPVPRLRKKRKSLEPRRHRGKAFFSSPCLCASVVIFFHGKGKEKLFLVLFVFFVVPFFSEPFCDTLVPAD